jgi:hypothetical protein
MENTERESVWVVALTRKPWAGWPRELTPVAEVERHNLYHYPLRPHYPRIPPTMIGFRYDGQLQSIHRVERDETVATPFGHVPGAPNAKWDEPHALLHLGPPIRPDHSVRTGVGIYGPGRHWADLDLLLSSPTFADAVRASKVRHRL